MPRLSEKTLELTLCSQISFSIGRLMVWFGLTQKQEALAGFDACTAINGQLCVFQFKASSITTRYGERRFTAPHRQMEQLRELANGTPGNVFYVFPLVGTVNELTTRKDVINYTWLLDVADIPPLSPPTTRSGGLRASENHYVDVQPPIATIHSNPVRVKVTQAAQITQVITKASGLLKANPRAQHVLLGNRHPGRKIYATYF
jgi:hypothetical protein